MVRRLVDARFGAGGILHAGMSGAVVAERLSRAGGVVAVSPPPGPSFGCNPPLCF